MSSESNGTSSTVPTVNHSTAKPITFTLTKSKTGPKRRKRADKDAYLPGSVTQLIPESALFSSLTAFERQLDSLIAERSVQLQDCFNSVKTQRQVMRLYVWHECDNNLPLDPNITVDPAFHEPPSFTLRIHGHWVDPLAVVVGPGIAGPPGPLRTLANHLDSFTVKFSDHLIAKSNKRQKLNSSESSNSTNKSEIEDESFIEWHSNSAKMVTDGFEIHRCMTDKSGEARITLNLATYPRSYQLSQSLLRITGGPNTQSMARVTKGLWEYLSFNHLLSPTDATQVVPNDAITILLGNSPTQLSFAQLLKYIETNHLSPIEPIRINHYIDVTQPGGLESTQIFDIDVELHELPVLSTISSQGLIDTASQLSITSSFSSTAARFDNPKMPSISREIGELDKTIEGLMKDMHALEKRRQFLKAFATSPIESMQLLLAQHAQHAMMTATTVRAQHAEKQARLQEEQRKEMGDSATSLSLGSSESVALMPGQEEKSRRAEYYVQSEWMHDAIDRYLNANSEAKRYAAHVQRQQQPTL